MRLDRYLGDLGAGSRSELKKTIRKDGVRIGQEWIRDPGFLIDPEKNPSVLYHEQEWHYEPFVWYMMNKPQGVLSASEDRKQPTVLDLIRTEEVHIRTDLFPVGRLDKDTEGLLLVTNDGITAHRLLSPKFHVDKAYYVKADGAPFTPSDADLFRKGIPYDRDLTALPSRMEILGPHEIRVTIREGKFHQIRKMVAALGNGKSVIYLRRETFGPLSLDPALQPGGFRRLTEEEISLLQNAAD